MIYSINFIDWLSPARRGWYLATFTNIKHLLSGVSQPALTETRNQFHPFWGGNNLQFLRKPVRRWKWWVVSGEVKCLDYVNLISWYHDPEGQGFILEIIISIRTWHVVVWSGLIVFISFLSWVEWWSLSYVFVFSRNILIAHGHYEHSLWEDGKCISISSAFNSLIMEAIINLGRQRIFKTMRSFMEHNNIIKNNDFQSKPG